ncbi:ferrous iron transporter B, partial [Sphingosinicella sp. YJ22]|uniref:ferrous iron transporter B n=1 Tax=Sphingosinicella sp. YJ22 TaxID=1104780 RepID=UPI001408F9DC
RGADSLREALSEAVAAPRGAGSAPDALPAVQRRARELARKAIVSETVTRRWTRGIDSFVLHPVSGPILFAAIMFLMFQAVFAWSEAPIGWIEGGIAALQGLVTDALPDGVLRSAIVDGVFAGVGAVVVFLPQILILFLFIMVLETSGYMVRAAFMMDRLMASVGLSGHAFIPLLSSFACAVPGIMATRTIQDPKHRLTTILVAPLMTCSARLPVYAIIIGAFIPATSVGWGVGLQGLVLFGLYFTGIVAALLAAAVIRRTVTRGTPQGFMLEMPKYQMPHVRDVMIGVWTRAMIFLKRAGTIILVSTIVLWGLLSFPQPKEGESALETSIAGRIAGGLETVVRPIGFNHEIALALIPAMAAREVAVSALATAYSIDAADEEAAEQPLIEQLRGRWSLPTALAFLAWFVFAPQCLSTIAVTRRETAGWKWPLFMILYLFVLAYAAAGITYWTAVALGL